MTYKNTKTILFASLIVAMVLPFSGMQSVNAEHITQHEIPTFPDGTEGDGDPDGSHLYGTPGGVFSPDVDLPDLPDVTLPNGTAGLDGSHLPIGAILNGTSQHPGAPMVNSTATEFNYEEKQQNLVDMLAEIEVRIANAPNDTVIENLELIKQRILGKLLEASLYENGAAVRNFYPTDELITPNFFIEGDHLGCNSVSESWSFNGYIVSTRNVVLIDQNFPDIFTSDGNELCDQIAFGSIHLTVQPAIFGEGCQSVIDTTPTADYMLDCQTDVARGLWIVGITFDYGSYSETKYTYVDV